jgi:hypothetical protein
VRTNRGQAGPPRLPTCPGRTVEPTAISWDVDDGQAHVELPQFEPDEVDAADLLMEMFRTSGWSDGY